jgi:hypothetical protein
MIYQSYCQMQLLVCVQRGFSAKTGMKIVEGLQQTNPHLFRFICYPCFFFCCMNYTMFNERLNVNDKWRHKLLEGAVIFLCLFG